MSRIAPTPSIRLTLRKWSVDPGMSYAVVEDTEGRTWIEQSSPVGTQYWTVEQAAQLPTGHRTKRALDEAVALGCERLSLHRIPSLPRLDSVPMTSPVRSRRTACAPDRRLARV